MFKNMRINTEMRNIDGLPPGWITIFLADISSLFGPFTYCAVMCPETMLPKNGEFYSSLVGAKAALFGRFSEKVHETIVMDVFEGYKTKNPGCKAVFCRPNSSGFDLTVHSYDGEHLFDSRLVHPKRILICL